MRRLEIFRLILPMIEGETDLAKLIFDKARESGIEPFW